MGREIPILFSTEMVRAILAGRKTMTRRVIKPQPDGRHRRVDFEYGFLKESSRINGCWEVERRSKCPYGQPGDLLWVRETWYYENHMHDLTAGEPDLPGGLYSHRFIFRASIPDYPVDVGVGEHGWKPSIFMPKIAARLWLEVVSVRVERLQDITEDDAIAEGLACLTKDNGITYKYGIPDSDGLPGNDDCGWHWHNWDTDPIKAFHTLWDSINAKPKAVLQTVDDHTEIISYVSYPWEDIQETREYRGKPWVVCGNPWLWVVEFRRGER